MGAADRGRHAVGKHAKGRQVIPAVQRGQAASKKAKTGVYAAPKKGVIARLLGLSIAVVLVAVAGCQPQGNDPGKSKPPVCVQGPDGRPRVTPCRVSTPKPIPHPTR